MSPFSVLFTEGRKTFTSVAAVRPSGRQFTNSFVGWWTQLFFPRVLLQREHLAARRRAGGERDENATSDDKKTTKKRKRAAMKKRKKHTIWKSVGRWLIAAVRHRDGEVWTRSRCRGEVPLPAPVRTGASSAARRWWRTGAGVEEE